MALRRQALQASSLLLKQIVYPSSSQFLQNCSQFQQTHFQSSWLGGKPRDILTPIRAPANFGFQIVPEKQAYVIERFGGFYNVLEPGLHLLIPFIDRVAYVHSLKELSIPVGQATAITKDNVSITVDGMLYVKVVDAKKASYGVDNPLFAVVQLAQTTMRSELGKITLDKTFEEREALNHSMVHAINQAADPWGLECMRFEIKDIMPPPGITKAMELQAEAERKKRAQVLESEGARQARINIAEGQKQEVILSSEAAQMDAINRAVGQAEGMLKQAEATSKGLKVVANVLLSKGGNEAAALRVAERYIEAFGGIAKSGNTLIIPASTNDPGAMVAQAMAMYKAMAPQLQQQETDTDEKESPANQTSESDTEVDMDSVKTTSDATTVLATQQSKDDESLQFVGDRIKLSKD
eukprot:TRINITY_DN8237_c0_g1_i1.p1 TRINITY_DN8237_c0_g1~~TRINITY_DN8237_c0_g1_i1.p1  ORF type:complete len:410 (-),score=69.63 TRINITY_DN8237_c0_g1_i1:193-1422(-)